MVLVIPLLLIRWNLALPMIRPLSCDFFFLIGELDRPKTCCDITPDFSGQKKKSNGTDQKPVVNCHKQIQSM